VVAGKSIANNQVEKRKAMLAGNPAIYCEPPERKGEPWFHIPKNVRFPNCEAVLSQRGGVNIPVLRDCHLVNVRSETPVRRAVFGVWIDGALPGVRLLGSTYLILPSTILRATATYELASSLFAIEENGGVTFGNRRSS
jgi:hypothetical protein